VSFQAKLGIVSGTGFAIELAPCGCSPTHASDGTTDEKVTSIQGHLNHFLQPRFSWGQSRTTQRHTFHAGAASQELR
jgi:hypothetical protein